MIILEEVPIGEIESFWKEHIKYLIEDEIIDSQEDITYFASDEYRGVIKRHMERSKDRHCLIYFSENGKRIGACSYCIYRSEDGKCFILDFWVFPRYRGNGMGHRCFEALESYTKADGAAYYELNSSKNNSVRFWKSIGFEENGTDEYGEKLFIKR